MKTAFNFRAWGIALGLAFVHTVAEENSAKLFHADEIMLAGSVGVVGSKFMTQGDQKTYLDPNANARGRVEATYGLTFSSRWKWFSASLGAWQERVGQTAPKTTVEFPNNPFPQTLEAKPWIDYFVLPLQAGFGAVGKRQSLFVHAGVYLALEEGSRLPWVVNGSPYYGAPVPSTQDSDNGWSLELEYAFRLRHGSLLLSAGSRKSFSSIVTGMDGSTRLGTGTVSLGYGFDL